MSDYVQDIKLIARDVDREGYLLPNELLTMMQEAGASHSALLGVGMFDLRAKNLGWVITRALIQMKRYPKIGETLHLKTWPGKTRLSLYPRYYTFWVGQEQIGSASTLYVMLDLSARTIAKPEVLGRPIAVDNDEKPLPFPGNLTMIPEKPAITGYQPVYTDFDVNGHVNNTRYVRWFIDQYGCDKHKAQQLSSLLIHFDHEIRPEQEVRFERQEQGDTSVFRCFVEDTNCFSVQGQWSDRA